MGKEMNVVPRSKQWDPRGSAVCQHTLPGHFTHGGRRQERPWSQLVGRGNNKHRQLEAAAATAGWSQPLEGRPAGKQNGRTRLGLTPLPPSIVPGRTTRNESLHLPKLSFLSLTLAAAPHPDANKHLAQSLAQHLHDA